MNEINLINCLEIISSKISNRPLKLDGYIRKKHSKEQLEVIIFKGFSSSTTHPIQINPDKKVIEFHYYLINFRLYKALFSKRAEDFIRENENYSFFLNPKNWI